MFKLIIIRSGSMTDKVALDFMGGGACFSDETCNAYKYGIVGKKFYTDEHLISAIRSMGHGKDMREGTYATTVAPQLGFWPTTDDHPLADYTYIALIFCTADLFIGNQVTKYPNYWYDDTKFHHTGADNARAVIDMVKTHAPDVKKMFIIGGSAGGVGIHVWAPIITAEFPNTEVTAWSDSGLPWVPENDAFTRAVNKKFETAWNVPNNLTTFESGDQSTPFDFFQFKRNFINQVKHFKGRLQFSHFEFAHDVDLQNYHNLLIDVTKVKDSRPLFEQRVQFLREMKEELHGMHFS